MEGYAFHPEADLDLNAIWEFIVKGSLDSTNRGINAIETTIAALVPFPHPGHRHPDLTSRLLRFTNAGSYMIAYASDEKPLLIVAIMNCGDHARASQSARHRGDAEEQAVICPRRNSAPGSAH
jgi:plasmid stabilization system protein ParE